MLWETALKLAKTGLICSDIKLTWLISGATAPVMVDCMDDACVLSCPCIVDSWPRTLPALVAAEIAEDIEAERVEMVPTFGSRDGKIPGYGTYASERR